jgi:hypothetical protein
MPALFAYLVAVSLLLGGGYVSLHWLSAPPDASTDLRPSASKGRPAKNDLVKKSDPYAAAQTRAEKRPDDHAETEIAASRLGSEASGKAVSEAPPNETGVNEDNTKAQTKKAEDVPTDGCVPLGLTAQGELVFPIQCQALPERHRGAAVSQPPVQTHPTRSAPAPKQAQAAEPARLDGNENADLNRRQSPGNAATAKVVNVSPSGEAKPEEAKSEEAKSEEAKSGEAKPDEAKSDEAKSDEAKPGKENSPPVAANGKNVGKRMMQSAHSKPVMMILRTVEFPDGHREQHLLPMSHLRSTAFRTEEEWFDPLTFR